MLPVLLLCCNVTPLLHVRLCSQGGGRQYLQPGSVTPCSTAPLTPPCCCCRLLSAAEGEDAVRGKLRAVGEELTERFRTLEEEFR